MPDRKKVKRGLECCCEHIEGMNCGYCPYDVEQTEIGEINQCTSALAYDALELLKEQETKIEQLNRFVNGFSRDAMPVVRCKDCKYWDAEEHDCNIKIGWFACGADWFCADGERRAEE